MKRVLLVLITGLTLVSCNMKKPLIIGHRGAMGHETENTLASVQKAMDLGVDMIEIDVFKVKSGEIVVFHDENVERLTNGPGSIEDYNYIDLKKLIVDGGHKIPMLQDVLKLIDNKVALNIELKGANTADRVNHIMTYYIENKGWSAENFIISSFNWDELREMRTLNPNVKLAILTEEDPTEAIPIAKELNAVAINPYYKNVNLQVANTIREAGLKIYVWTVNEEEDINAMKRIDVDGIITNYPERIN
ncbi:glycerophosphodiester phosphodiesterase family protein [Maribacter cobaltidurans]|uniref:Glycerophosphodiester phosphodiesterase family protein n=1 Tax=Maribacter cobaltidurans TaxID=1178778 RepID=A0ABU7IRS4_9FLAO|nr:MULTISPECIES: glycerophosphodiester phosphodiesterase family protein [Maribacter]MEE1975667.1 glycerophosphodiester phosphodiesterase family protein [Maribacter cobaltidurans]